MVAHTVIFLKSLMSHQRYAAVPCTHECTCSLRQHMQGLWRPESWGEVDVEIKLLDWRAPPVVALNVKLFDIPMGQQRYAFVLDVIRQHSAQSVVDLGCGDGKLMEYLLQKVICSPKIGAAHSHMHSNSGLSA